MCCQRGTRVIPSHFALRLGSLGSVILHSHETYAFPWSIQEAIALLCSYRPASDDKQSSWMTSSYRDHEEDKEFQED